SALADLLPVVLPVDAVPVEVVVNAVFETGPDGGARVRCGGVDDDGPSRRAPAVVDPIFMTARPFFSRALDIVAERPRVPDVNRAVQLLDVMLGHKCQQCFPWSWIGVQVVC